MTCSMTIPEDGINIKTRNAFPFFVVNFYLARRIRGTFSTYFYRIISIAKFILYFNVNRNNTSEWFRDLKENFSISSHSSSPSSDKTIYFGVR